MPRVMPSLAASVAHLVTRAGPSNQSRLRLTNAVTAREATRSTPTPTTSSSDHSRDVRRRAHAPALRNAEHAIERGLQLRESGRGARKRAHEPDGGRPALRLRRAARAEHPLEQSTALGADEGAALIDDVAARCFRTEEECRDGGEDQQEGRKAQRGVERDGRALPARAVLDPAPACAAEQSRGTAPTPSPGTSPPPVRGRETRPSRPSLRCAAPTPWR